jgi:hypothetical protein
MRSIKNNTIAINSERKGKEKTVEQENGAMKKDEMIVHHTVALLAKDREAEKNLLKFKVY